MKLERRAPQTYPNPPDTYFRYVDDTFTHMLEEHIHGFLDQRIEQHKRFTIEYEVDRSIQFTGLGP